MLSKVPRLESRPKFYQASSRSGSTIKVSSSLDVTSNLFTRIAIVKSALVVNPEANNSP